MLVSAAVWIGEAVTSWLGTGTDSHLLALRAASRERVGTPLWQVCPQGPGEEIPADAEAQCRQASPLPNQLGVDFNARQLAAVKDVMREVDAAPVPA
jgi:hypothetical protein